MPLIEEFERSGAWLFRWRSYLPLLFLPLIILAVVRYPLLDDNFRWHFAWSLNCFAISLAGLWVRCHTVGHAPPRTSGRNTKEQVAESLNTLGLYSIVRHPLYLGNCLIVLGIVMQTCSWWLIALYATSFALYYERIMFTEEMFLRNKFGREFIEWGNHTPAFIPSIRQWTKVNRPMDWEKVVQQECAAIAVITVAFPGLELAIHSNQPGDIGVETWWSLVAITGIILYAIARVMKRRLRKKADCEASVRKVGKR